MKSPRRLLAGLGALATSAALAAATLLLPSGATAQQAGVFEIVVSGQSLATVASGPGTLGESLGELRAYANGVECTRANVATTSDVSLKLGLAGQPAECSTEGAKVVLVDIREYQLATDFTLQKGASVTLTNLAPLPPHMQEAARLARTMPAASAAGLFEIVVSGESLSSPLNPTATGFSTLGEALGELSVYANGFKCTSASVATTSDVLLQVGLAGQPAACSSQGVPVSLVDSRDNQLAVQYTLHKGIRVTLTNLAPLPPDLQDQARRQRNGQTGAVSPPAAGDAGLAAER